MLEHIVGRTLVVEPRHEQTQSFERIINRGLQSTGRSIAITSQDDLPDESFDRVVYSAFECENVSLPDLVKSLSRADDYVIFANEGIFANALELVIPQANVVRPNTGQTKASYLFADELNPIKIDENAHTYRNRFWQKLLPQISESLQSHNSQRLMEYQFMLFSDRQRSLLRDEQSDKVNVVDLGYEPTKAELEQSPVIFVDNHWDGEENYVGEGITTVKRLRERTNKPIVYQTGHDQIDESQLTQIPRVLVASKDVFPKVCYSEVCLDKEKRASEIAKQTPELDERVVDIQYALGDTGTYVILSTAITEKEVDYSQRMITLARLHETTQQHKDKFPQNVPHFMSAEELRVPEEHRDIYDTICANPKYSQANVLSHNDAKANNWIGKTLIDFSNASPGYEGKDIARSLLDSPDMAKEEFIEEHVAIYNAERARLNTTYQSFQLTQGVQDMLITEGFRIGHYMDLFGNREDMSYKKASQLASKLTPTKG